MEQSLRILVVEDNEDDFFFINKYLISAEHYRFTVSRAIRLADALGVLEENGIDIVLLDLTLPDSSGIETFSTLHEAYPKVPIVILTGLDDDDVGIGAVQDGAQDFISKGEYSGKMLLTVIRHAHERQKLLQKLQDALDEVKTLRGFLPICMYCKKIRDDEGYWQGLERYITEHSDAQFSHGICPACYEEHRHEFTGSSEE